MGMMRNAEIEARQALIGLKPATGGRAELLEKMSNAAFDLIKIIELERSGIRDGDGHWSGTDVMGHTTRELVSIIAAYDAFEDHEYEAQLKKHGITADDFPW